MKILISVLFFLGHCLAVNAQQNGIQFSEGDSFQAFLDKAKAENKILFIDCYATWCVPCRIMEEKVFPEKEVGDFYNTNFVNLKLDVDSNPISQEIKEKYIITGFPTFLYVDYQGNLIHKVMGGSSSGEFINQGKIALKNNQKIQPCIAKIDNGDRSFNTIASFLKIAPETSKKNQLIEDYFKTIENKEKFEENAWYLINNYIDDLENPHLQFLIQHKEKYEKKYTAKAIQRKLFTAFEREYYKNNKDTDSVTILLKEIDTNAFSMLQTKLSFIESRALVQKNEGLDFWKDFIEKAGKYYNLDLAQPKDLNNTCWYIYENYKSYKDLKALKQAKLWSKKTINAEPENHYFNDTYAHILFDLGEVKKAINYQSKAVDLDPSNIFYSKELARYKGVLK